jgi:hypothetical protein
MSKNEDAGGGGNLLCLARVSPLNKLSEYLQAEAVAIESHYPPLRHVDKYKMEAVQVNYFFYGQCNYVLPMPFGQKKSTAIGMLFDAAWVDDKGHEVIHFPFDSGACMDARYVPHIADHEFGVFAAKTNVSSVFNEIAVRFFGNITSYFKGEHIKNMVGGDETERKLCAHYDAVPNDRVDMRGKTIEVLLPEQIDFSHLKLLVLPEESIKKLGFDVSEIRNKWPGVVVETYNDAIDPSPLADTQAIQGAVFAFYDRKGYFS